VQTISTHRAKHTTLTLTPGLHGSKIAIMGRRKEVLDKAVAQLTSEGVDAIGVQGDVRKFEDCERVVANTISKYEKIGILT
jgi:2,4-dienoyl-CoA reductase [(3E)-enoyl-CoA-producing], peroxisomal